MDINIGVELEFPKKHSSREHMKDAAVQSNDIRMRLGDQGFRLNRGNIVYDGTVGLEAVSEVLPLQEAANWYRNTVETIEDYGSCQYEPVSLIEEGPTTSTAGTHLHISPMNRNEAKDLYNLSTHPDVQLLTCSRVVQDETPDYPVFRSDYCGMNFNSDRYSVVNDRGNRWEWRLPEPQTMEHVENLFKFVKIFMEDGGEEALDYAKEKVTQGETTSIQRAREIGVTELSETDSYTVDRDSGKSSDFFTSVFEDRSAPYIYHVTNEDNGEEFYAFWSSDEGSTAVQHGNNTLRVEDGQVRRAKHLSRVTDAAVATDVMASVENYRMRDHGPAHDTEAKKRLNEVL
jgi:hypothetical protein